MSQAQLERATGVITQFIEARQYGFVQTNGELAFYHINFVRPDSIGRRFPYAKVGQMVTFTPFVHRGQLQAHDVTPVEPMPVIDPHRHREVSRIVHVTDAGDAGFVERSTNDQLYFRMPATQLAVGSAVEHSVFRDGKKFRATRLKLVSVPELTWPLDNVRPLHQSEAT